MADSFAADEVPEEDRLEQDIPVDEIEVPDPEVADPSGPLNQSWDADEGDRLEQSIEVPDEYDDRTD